MTLDQFKADLLSRFPWRPDMNYMAVDYCGAVCQYETRPRHTWPMSFWIADCNSEFIEKVEIPDVVDWRETLIERPAT